MCRWAGRNNRGKISVHVDFASELDVRGYCHPDLVADNYIYKLSAVVMHHGRGFGSGHYTAYCWNDEAGACMSFVYVMQSLNLFLLTSAGAIKMLFGLIVNLC